MLKNKKGFFFNVLPALILALGLGLAAEPALAATKTAAASGTWGTAGTWNPSGVPAAGDDVIINGGYTVSIQANVTAFPATITIGGATSGILRHNNGSRTITVTGNVTIESNGSWTVVNATGVNASTITIGGNLVVNGTLNMCSASDDYATVVFNGSSQQTISGSGSTCTFFSLTDSNTSGAGLVLARNIDVKPTSVLTTTVTVTAGYVFDLGAYTVNRTGAAGGSFIVNSGSTLKIGGTNSFPSGYTTYTLTGSTVEYNGSGTQTITVLNYNNLTSSGSGARILATTGNIGVAGTFTQGTNSYTRAGSTIDFNGTGAQNVPVFAYDNLIFSGGNTKTFAGATAISGSFNIASGTVANLGTYTSSSNTLYLNSAVQVAGSWGGTGSGATNINTTYFAAAAGILNVANTVNTFTWVGTTSTTWDVASNWSPTGVPTSASDNAVIATASNRPVIRAAAACNSITLNSGATLEISGSNTLTVYGNWTNNGGTFTAGTGTVNFSGTSQAIGGSGTTTFYNLSTGATTVVNVGVATNIGGNLSLGNGTIFSIGAYAVTVSGTTTVGGGGAAASLTISSATGAKAFTGLVTIANGSTWNNSGNSAVSFAGGITNNGTFNSGTGVNTFQTNAQALAGDLTIQSVTVTGITLTNNGALSVSTALEGTGGLTQGVGAILLLNFAGTPGITTLTATAANNTVSYALGDQTLIATTYVNLTLGGGQGKTFPSGTTTVNGVFSIENAEANTFTGTLAYGANATLQYNTATARTAAAAEWVTPFAATGGVIIKNTGAITLNAAKVFNASVPLTVDSGATLSMSTYLLTLSGDLINNGGTVSGETGGVTITGTATQSIDSFTTTGTVSMTKTAGTATLTGNVNGAGLTINGSGGTLNLGAGLTHTFTGTWTRTDGTLNGGSSTLNIGGSVSGTGGTFTAGTGTVRYNGDSQTVAALNYFNLDLSAATTAITLASSGTIGVAGAFTPPGAITKTITGSTVAFNGSSSQNIPAFAFNNLTVANSAGVTLTGIATVDATLTLTSGQVTSTSTNLLAVTNTATSAVTGYSSASYVNGPLQWSLATGGSYFFPVGDASYYRPFELNSITCSSPVVRVTMASAGASTVDGTLSSVAPRNWYAQLISGSFTSATVKITESGLDSNNVVASSTAQSGNYTNRGGNSIGSTITSDPGISYTASTYFAIGSTAASTSAFFHLFE